MLAACFFAGIRILAYLCNMVKTFSLQRRRGLLPWAAGLMMLCSGCASQVKSGFVEVSEGGRIYYEERGKGEPLLLLHGHSLDTRMWDEQFKPFSRYFRTVRLDFRGYGRSSEQSETQRATHMDDLLAVMDSLGIGRASVVGLSMGAFVAGDLLALHPERCRKVVLASGSIRKGSPGPGEPMGAAEKARRDQEIAALKAKGVGVMKQEWLEQLMSSGGSHRERMRLPLRRMIEDWPAWQPLHKEARLFYGKEAWTVLKQKRPATPVLMLRGENEHRKGRPEELRYLPNGRLLILPDCGHMMNMEQPRFFNSLIISYLKLIPN